MPNICLVLTAHLFLLALIIKMISSTAQGGAVKIRIIHTAVSAVGFGSVHIA